MPLDDPWLIKGPSTTGDSRAPVPAIRAATPIRVYRVGDPVQPEGGGEAVARMEELPNLVAVRVHQRRGSDPGKATFRYRFGIADPEAPGSMEQAIGDGSELKKVVRPGDRLVITAEKPETTEDVSTDDDPEWQTTPGEEVAIFDGHALDFGATLREGTEEVHIEAVGRAYRARDQIVGGQILRDANAATDPTKNKATDLIARFNPKGTPNATPDGADFANPEGNRDYPVFIDPATPIRDAQGARTTRTWTLPMAVRYLLYTTNADEEFVTNPDGKDIDKTLVAREPIEGTPFDASKPETWTPGPLNCPDKPVTGKDVMAAVEDMIGAKGYAMAFRLVDKGPGVPPETTLDVYHPQEKGTKSVYLQAGGENLDLTRTNVNDLEIGRNLEDVASEWTVVGAQERHEISAILEPGYPAEAADAGDSDSLKKFDRNGPDFEATYRDKYRLYTLDEAGEGYYGIGSATKLQIPANLDAVLGKGKYAVKRRRPIGELISTDESDRPLRFELAMSRDYEGGRGLWDGTGTWQKVTGGFELLKDRIGIWINAEDANEWKVGSDKETGQPTVVKGVEDMATPKPGTNFILRLTVVIEGDMALRGKAERRDSSPLPYPIARMIDARDRYRKDTQSHPSAFNYTGGPFVVRDDTEAATDEAEAVRDATDTGLIDGRIRIPRFTDYYEIGDRIDSIDGRGLGLRTDAAGDAEGPLYPTVVGRTYEFDGKRETILDLSDAGTSRHIFRRKVHRAEHRW